MFETSGNLKLSIHPLCNPLFSFRSLIGQWLQSVLLQKSPTCLMVNSFAFILQSFLKFGGVSLPVPLLPASPRHSFSSPLFSCSSLYGSGNGCHAIILKSIQPLEPFTNPDHLPLHVRLMPAIWKSLWYSPNRKYSNHTSTSSSSFRLRPSVS